MEIFVETIEIKNGEGITYAFFDACDNMQIEGVVLENCDVDFSSPIYVTETECYNIKRYKGFLNE